MLISSEITPFSRSISSASNRECEQHVGQHVDGDARRVGRALDVVGRQLLAGEGVELAADAVDLGRDVARRGAALGALEEHVLGEVGDAGRRRLLVAGARGEADEDGDGRRAVHAGRQDAHAVGERRGLEHRPRVAVRDTGPDPRGPFRRIAVQTRRTPPWCDRGVATDRSADRPPVLARRVRSVGGGPREGAPRRAWRRRASGCCAAAAACAERRRASTATAAAAVRPLRARRAVVARPDGAHDGAAGRADGVQPARPLRDLERQGRRRAADARPVPRAAPALARQLLARSRTPWPRDHAMQWWLDTIGSNKSDPNENFARELMELFTLGVGHYTERDVREAARAFTGFDYDWNTAAGTAGDPDAPRHGVKTHLRPPRPVRPGRRGRPLPATTPPTRRSWCSKLWGYFIADAAVAPRRCGAMALAYRALGPRAAAGAADDPLLAGASTRTSRSPTWSSRRSSTPPGCCARSTRGRHRRLDVAAVEHGPAAVLPAERGRLADERGVADDAVGQGPRRRRRATARPKGLKFDDRRPQRDEKPAAAYAWAVKAGEPAVDVAAHAPEPAGDGGHDQAGRRLGQPRGGRAPARAAPAAARRTRRAGVLMSGCDDHHRTLAPARCSAPRRVVERMPIPEELLADGADAFYRSSRSSPRLPAGRHRRRAGAVGGDADAARGSCSRRRSPRPPRTRSTSSSPSTWAAATTASTPCCR